MAAVPNRSAVLQLYRRAMRAIPSLIMQYELDVRPAQMRRRVSEAFKEHKDETDPDTVDLLMTKGTMELDETVQFWKTKAHVMKWVAPETMPREEENMSPFMRKFLAGEVE